MIVTTQLLPTNAYHHFALTIRQRTSIGAHLVAVPIDGARWRARFALLTIIVE